MPDRFSIPDRQLHFFQCFVLKLHLCGTGDRFVKVHHASHAIPVEVDSEFFNLRKKLESHANI